MTDAAGCWRRAGKDQGAANRNQLAWQVVEDRLLRARLGIDDQIAFAIRDQVLLTVRGVRTLHTVTPP